jgi:hypothetical protein
MKKHTCKGLKEALKQIDSFRDNCGPYVIPEIEGRYLSGHITGMKGELIDIERTLGGTLHGMYVVMNYCQFCGYKF